jgi:hypothetical protein
MTESYPQAPSVAQTVGNLKNKVKKMPIFSLQSVR